MSKTEDGEEDSRMKKIKEEDDHFFDSFKDEVVPFGEFEGKTHAEMWAELKKRKDNNNIVDGYDFSEGVSYGTIEKLICSDDWKKIKKETLEFWLVNYINDWYDSRAHIPEIAKCIRNKENKISPYFDELLFDCLWHQRDIDKAEVIIKILVTAFGAETVRKKITEDLDGALSAEEEYGGNEGQSKLISQQSYLRSFITPFKNKEFIGNLKKFYEEKIRFENYGLNREVKGKEVELLKSLIPQDEKTLEVGCGTGRLFLEMKKAGYDISGFDFADHVKKIKEKDPEANIFEGDWHHIGVKDGSVDTIYSLGRNILHDYLFIDQMQTFQEANRVLKKGGRFIFDIPDREKGSYRMMVEEYASEMEKLGKRGIQNFRYGSIYDSPDGTNFATRYAYSENDIKELANLTGFKIVKKEARDLNTGKGDENWYYVLEKVAD